MWSKSTHLTDYTIYIRQCATKHSSPLSSHRGTKVPKYIQNHLPSPTVFSFFPALCKAVSLIHSSPGSTRQRISSTAPLKLEDSDPKSWRVPKNDQVTKVTAKYKAMPNISKTQRSNKNKRDHENNLIKPHFSCESISSTKVVFPEPNTFDDLNPYRGHQSLTIRETVTWG